jgi:hypothetical protein
LVWLATGGPRVIGGGGFIKAAGHGPLIGQNLPAQHREPSPHKSVSFPAAATCLPPFPGFSTLGRNLIYSAIAASASSRPLPDASQDPPNRNRRCHPSRSSPDAMARPPRSKICSARRGRGRRDRNLIDTVVRLADDDERRWRQRPVPAARTTNICLPSSAWDDAVYAQSNPRSVVSTSNLSRFFDCCCAFTHLPAR